MVIFDHERLNFVEIRYVCSTLYSILMDGCVGVSVWQC